MDTRHLQTKFCNEITLTPPHQYNKVSEKPENMTPERVIEYAAPPHLNHQYLQLTYAALKIIKQLKSISLSHKKQFQHAIKAFIDQLTLTPENAGIEPLQLIANAANHALKSGAFLFHRKQIRLYKIVAKLGLITTFHTELNESNEPQTQALKEAIFSELLFTFHNIQIPPNQSLWTYISTAQNLIKQPRQSYYNEIYDLNKTLCWAHGVHTLHRKNQRRQQSMASKTLIKLGYLNHRYFLTPSKLPRHKTLKFKSNARRLFYMIPQHIEHYSSSIKHVELYCSYSLLIDSTPDEWSKFLTTISNLGPITSLTMISSTKSYYFGDFSCKRLIDFIHSLSLQKRTIQAIDLSYTPLGSYFKESTTLKALAEGIVALSPTWLNLECTEIGTLNESQLEVFLGYLSKNNSLKELRLGRNYLGKSIKTPDHADLLGSLLARQTGLTKLCLKNNAFTRRNQAILYSILESLSTQQNLISLNLSENKIGTVHPEYIRSLGHTLQKFKNLKALGMRRNELNFIAPHALIDFGASLSMLTELCYLDLRGNKLNSLYGNTSYCSYPSFFNHTRHSLLMFFLHCEKSQTKINILINELNENQINHIFYKVLQAKETSSPIFDDLGLEINGQYARLCTLENGRGTHRVLPYG